MRLLKLFGYMCVHNGNIEMTVRGIIPYLLYVSKSDISNSGKKHGVSLYTLHITPFLAIGFVWRG